MRAPLATRGYRFPITNEAKTIDTGAAPQVSTTGAFALLNGCIQGTDYTNRIGRKIMLKSLYIRGIVASDVGVTMTSPAITVAQQARMIIFCDNQPNGATPAVLDLLNNATTVSQLNLNNRDRFKILVDKTFVLDPIVYNTTATQSVAAATNQIRQYKKFKKLNMETIYNSGNAGTVGDMNTGALWLFWIGSQAVGVGTDATATWTCRVRFNDP